MIFTDLALRVINPFIIKTVLKSSDTSEPKLSYSQVLRGGQISEISQFLKTVGGGRSTCPAGLASSSLWHSPGIWTFQFYAAGQAGASFHQCGDYHRTAIFRKNGHFVGFTRDPGPGERSQVAGAGMSEQTVVWPGAQGRGNVIFTLILWITIKSDGDLELSCSKQQKKIGQKMLTFIMEKYFSKKMKWNLAGLNCQ